MKFIAQANFKIKEWCGTFRIIYNYIITDIEKKPRVFKIGVSSIFIVVCFLVILQSALHLTPLIFIRLAENQNGQYDLTITPIGAENDSRALDSNVRAPVIRAVNLTELEEKLGNMPEISGMSPRWLLPVRLSSPSNPSLSFQAVAIILDSERERKNGIGRNLDVPDLKPQQCWISKTVQRLLKIKDDQVTMTLDILGSFSKLQTISIGGMNQLPPEEELERLAKKFIEENFDARQEINLDALEIDKETILASMTLAKIALRTASRSDGTINFDLLNMLLVASGLIPQSLPLSALGDIQTEMVISLFDLVEEALNTGSIEIDPKFLADTVVPILLRSLMIQQDYKVTSIVEKPNGKWPEELGNVIVIDSKYVTGSFLNNFLSTIRNVGFQTPNPAVNAALQGLVHTPQFESFFNTIPQAFDLNQYCLSVNILLNNRTEIYASQETLMPHLLKITNAIYTRLGIDHPSTIISSLETIIKGLFIFKSLLDNVFNATVFILLLLSVLLIYSLMHSNVEEKTYEFGMLRALGMKQDSLMSLLSLQSMFYSIPGLFLGMVLAYTFNTCISYFVFNYTSISSSYSLPTPAIVTGFCIAIFVPFASNIIPIRRALSKTLRDSLNIYHRVVSDMTVRIMKLAKLGISPAQTVAALTMVILGFITYDVAPYSFIFQKITLFFLIITGVLMLLIIGFTILLNLLQNPSEKAVLKIIMLLFSQHQQLESVIVKNLGAHRNRNTKTSLMFSIALAFLIFAGTSFRLNASLLTDQVKAGLGADLVIKSLPIESTILKENEIRDALENYKRGFPDVIRDYAFVSMPFGRQPGIPWGKLTTLAGTPVGSVEVVSVDESYLRASYEDFYLPTERDQTAKVGYLLNTKKFDGIQSLYTKEGLQELRSYDQFGITSNSAYRNSSDLDSKIGANEIRLIVSTGAAIQLSAYVGTPSLLTFSKHIFRARIRETATKFPGFFFTGYRMMARTYVLTSHEDYKYMSDFIYAAPDTYQTKEIQKFRTDSLANSTYGVPKHNLLVRLKPGVDRETRLSLFNILQTLVDGQFSFVIDVVGTSENLEENLVFIDIFFILVSIIAISLSFFFTIVSFVSNISENSWEFGVLRAIGLNKDQMTKVYVYEALCIIIASGILGTIVGVIVALATTIQFNLFTELPFRFLFPVTVFLFTIVISILTAIYGSKSAVNDIKDRQISSIIKALE